MYDPLLLAGLAAIVVGTGVAIALDRRARERRRRAHQWRRYRYGGGLVRDLLSRWQKNNRLTDQRDLRDRGP